jgi:PAS domain S-box-containing protein
MRHFANALDDPDRLAALRKTALLDAPARESFDRLTRLVRRVLDVPVAMISLIDDHRQFFVGFVGLPEPWASRRQTPLSHSFCQYTVRFGEPFVISDARRDPLLSSNLAIPDLGVIAYAGVPLRDAEGEVLGSIAAADTRPREWTDNDLETLQEFAALAAAVISERTAAVQREVAQEKVAHLAAVFETTSDLVGAITAEGQLLYLNRAGRDLLGVGPGESVFEIPLADFYSADSKRVLEAEALPGAIEAGVWSGEVLCATRAGREVPLVQTLTAHRMETGRVGFLSTTARDLSREREAQRALRESEHLVRSIVASAGEGIVVYDRDLRYLLWNPMMEKLTGVAATDLLGKRALDMFPELREQGVEALLHRALAGEAGQTSDLPYPIPGTGENGWVISHHSPLRSTSGEVFGVVSIVHEITDRKRAEEERMRLLDREREARAVAERANLAKSDFLTLVSHELRTPLATTISFAELLESGIAGPLSDRQREYVARILDSTWHLTHLVDEILEFTRMESGHIRIRPERMDAIAAAESVLVPVRPLAESKGLALELMAPPGPLWLDSDADRVRQVLASLVSNAVSFTDRGRVSLEIDTPDDAIVFRIADTGIGIAEEHVEDVFSAFWQIENPLTRRVGGAGLGLSIARRLARLLGGEIDVRSVPGEGSTFTLTLPRRAPPVPPPAADPQR